jgi:tripartite-type tricarboxylate transporter receptor subunit TctC
MVYSLFSSPRLHKNSALSLRLSMKRRLLLRSASVSAGAGALGAAGALLGLPSVRAQGAWPAKPITIINPFPAGGGTDALARPLSAQLARQLGKQVIIDNRGGAGGTVGASIASRAAPDGYTFFMGAVHHTIAPSMYPKLDYDIEKDFAPLMVVGKVPQVLVVHPQKVPVNSLKEFLEMVRKSPGKLNYASVGNGTSHHLAGELFKALTKTFITHIPYRGAGPALQDLVAGNVECMFDTLGSSAQFIRAGKLKALALAQPTRLAAFPELPTFAEAGVAGYEVSSWYGMWAMKDTPKDLQARMLDELIKAVQSPAIKTAWEGLGAEAVIGTQASFASFIASEITRWKAVVKTSGAKLD